MAGMRFLAVAAALLSVAAFEAEEHKLLGDVGSQNAFKRFPAALNGLSLLKAGAVTTGTSGDSVRLITRDALDKLIKLRGSKDKSFVATAFYPHHVGDAHLEANAPLQVWTGLGIEPIVKGFGKADSGAFFTFGDLVGAYGDVYRTMTCSSQTPGECRIGDNLSHFTAARRAAVRDLLAGKDILTRTAFAAAALKSDNSMGLFNRDGVNSDDALVLQELRLAYTNANHFSSMALQWYAAHHKQALLAIARAAEAKVKGKKAEEVNLQFMTAMHHDATGCHSLTDLFAPGHIITDRTRSSQLILENAKADKTAFPQWQSALLSTAPKGAPLSAVPRPLNDASYVSPGQFSFVAKSEESLHTDFNQGGARVRNLKTLLKAKSASAAAKYLAQFKSLHDEIKTGVNTTDGSWRAFGDKNLFFYGTVELNKDGSSPIPRVNAGHAEWASAAVEDSIVSLLVAYEELSKLKATDDFVAEANKISKTPAFWEALADIPLQVNNLCMTRGLGSRTHCFSPVAKSGDRPFQYVPYKNAILDYLSVPSALLPAATTVGPCTGNLKIDPTGWLCSTAHESEWLGDTERDFAIKEAKALKPNARFAELPREDDQEELPGAFTATAAAAKKPVSAADAAHKTAVELAEHARTLVDNAEAHIRRNRNNI